MSKRRQDCTNTNKITGTQAKAMRGTMIQYCPHNIRSTATEKAIIMVAIEKKRAKRLIIIFLGKDLRKSSSL